MATNFANSRLVTRLGSDWLLLLGTSGAALAGIGSLLCARLLVPARHRRVLRRIQYCERNEKSSMSFSRRPFLEKISPRPRDAGYSPSADLRPLGVIGPRLPRWR